jgi:hypothetical protein
VLSYIIRTYGRVTENVDASLRDATRSLLPRSGTACHRLPQRAQRSRWNRVLEGFCVSPNYVRVISYDSIVIAAYTPDTPLSVSPNSIRERLTPAVGCSKGCRKKLQSKLLIIATRRSLTTLT